MVEPSEGIAKARDVAHETRVTPRDDVCAIAYETFLGDGETWGNTVSFCLPKHPRAGARVVRYLGPWRPRSGMSCRKT
jgi:hypothetical protein